MKLKCSKCGYPLEHKEEAFVCENGHEHTKTAQGYFDLTGGEIPAGHKGNTPEIIQAKHSFLEKGFYSMLSEAIEDTVLKLSTLCPSPVTLIDCCCGEGYYTRNLFAEMKRSNKPVDLLAMDLSEEAVRLAAERSNGGLYALADAYQIPVMDGTADIVLNCFSPASDGEIARVLKPGGIFLSVIPGRMHLYAMKTALFDVPVVVDETGHVSKKLVRVKQVRVRDEIAMSEVDDLENLFKMSPEMANEGEYYLHRLKTLRDLEIETDFILQIFRKSKKVKL